MVIAKAKFFRTLFFFGNVVIIFASGNEIETIFVDPLRGDDANAGTSFAPLQSLHSAALEAQHLRSAGAEVIVNLLPGRHKLRSGTLTLQGDGRPITWRSADVSNPAIVDGGTEITHWKESVTVPGALEAPLPTTIPNNIPLRQLWVGGKRARRPRVWISLQWQGGQLQSNLTNVTDANGWVGFDFAKQIEAFGPKYDPAKWPNPADVEFVFHSNFVEPRCTADSVDGTIVKLSQPCFGDFSQRRQGPTKCNPTAQRSCPGMRPPWFIENVFSNLTSEAGQWYYHRANGTIFYMPRPGETAESVGNSAFTSIEETLLVVNKTSNMRWVGVTFEHATWNQPSLNRGYVDWQAGYSGGIYGTWPHYQDCRNETACRKFADMNGCGNTTKPPSHCGYGLGQPEVSGEDGNRGIEPSGNVRILESRNVTFTGCTFHHLGGLYAISANFGSQFVRILNCTFTDISGGAVHIGSSGSRWNTGPFNKDGGPTSVASPPMIEETSLSEQENTPTSTNVPKPYPETETCDATAKGQRWSLSPGVTPGDGKPTYLWITGSDNGKSTQTCLKVLGGCDPNDGTPVGHGSGGNCSITTPATCNFDHPCQSCSAVWSFNRNGTITSLTDGRCLQVDHSEVTANGSRINLAACTNQTGTEQHFSVTPTPSGGGYTIKSVHSGKCMGSAHIGAPGCIHKWGIPPRRTPGDNFDDWDGYFEVADNWIYDSTVEYQSAVGIFAGYVFNSTIAHNTLENLAYTGISVGWGWNQVTFAGGNQIANNSINGVLAAFRDGGNIYTQSHMRGSSITGNFVQHDGNAYGMIYTDGGSHVEVRDNVMNGGNAPCLFLHGGGCFKMGPLYYNDTGKPDLCCAAVPQWTPRGECDSKTGHGTLPWTNKTACSAHGGSWNPNKVPISFAHELDYITNNTWPSAAQTIIDNAGRRP